MAVFLHSAPCDAKINIGCLSLVSEMNGGNIRLRMLLLLSALSTFMVVSAHYKSLLLLLLLLC